MTQSLAVRDAATLMERAVIQGDLSQLSPTERVDYYGRVCDSLKLNPYTKPFEYLELDDGNGGKRLTLYARKDCTDQLRDIHNVSITRLEQQRTADLYIVTAYATTPDGRTDSAVGAVPIAKQGGAWKTNQNGKRYLEPDGTLIPLTGEALANAIMKAETKAKRRVTLSICGLGMTDESEIDSIPGARVVQAEYPSAAKSADDDRDLVRSADARIWQRWLEVRDEALGLGLTVAELRLPLERAALTATARQVLEQIAERRAELERQDLERARGAVEHEAPTPAEKSAARDRTTGEVLDGAAAPPSDAPPTRSDLWHENRRLVAKAGELGLLGVPTLNTKSGADVIASANEDLRARISAHEAALVEQPSLEDLPF